MKQQKKILYKTRKQSKPWFAFTLGNVHTHSISYFLKMNKFWLKSIIICFPILLTKIWLKKYFQLEKTFWLEVSMNFPSLGNKKKWTRGKSKNKTGLRVWFVKNHMSCLLDGNHQNKKVKLVLICLI